MLIKDFKNFFSEKYSENIPTTCKECNSEKLTKVDSFRVHTDLKNHKVIFYVNTICDDCYKSESYKFGEQPYNIDKSMEENANDK